MRFEKKHILTSGVIFLFLFLGFFYPKSVGAVTKTSGNLRLTVDEPMFPSSIIWYPGLNQSKTMTIENLGSVSQSVYIRAENTSQTGELGNVLYFNVKENSSNLYGGSPVKTLGQFWNSGDILLRELGGNSSFNPAIIINMDSLSGNEYQNKTAFFDLIVGFVESGEEVVVLASTSTGDSGGGGGGAEEGGELAVVVSVTPTEGFLQEILGESTPSAEIKDLIEDLDKNILGEKEDEIVENSWFNWRFILLSFSFLFLVFIILKYV